MNLTLITAPIAEPLSLQEARDHLRVLDDSEDAMISGWIAAAREYCQGFTRRQLVTASYRATWSAFGCEMRLPLGQLQSVESVQYVAPSGSTVTMDAGDYQVRVGDYGIVRPAAGKSWPAVACDTLEPVRIEFTSGYDGADDVPAAVKAAMKLLIGHWFENRQSVVVDQTVNEVPQAVEALLWMHRLEL